MIDDGTWTEALILHRTHGERAGTHVAEQIAMLARAGTGRACCLGKGSSLA